MPSCACLAQLRAALRACSGAWASAAARRPRRKLEPPSTHTLATAHLSLRTGTWESQGTVVEVRPQGTWYTPCWYVAPAAGPTCPHDLRACPSPCPSPASPPVLRTRLASLLVPSPPPCTGLRTAAAGSRRMPTSASVRRAGDRRCVLVPARRAPAAPRGGQGQLMPCPSFTLARLCRHQGQRRPSGRLPPVRSRAWGAGRASQGMHRRAPPRLRSRHRRLAPPDWPAHCSAWGRPACAPLPACSPAAGILGRGTGALTTQTLLTRGRWTRSRPAGAEPMRTIGCMLPSGALPFPPPCACAQHASFRKFHCVFLRARAAQPLLPSFSLLSVVLPHLSLCACCLLPDLHVLCDCKPSDAHTALMSRGKATAAQL